jgi:Protein of unknown function (DUF3309)
LPRNDTLLRSSAERGLAAGGFSGRFGGYGYGLGHSGMGLGGVILIVLVILVLLRKF